MATSAPVAQKPAKPQPPVQTLKDRLPSFALNTVFACALVYYVNTNYGESFRYGDTKWVYTIAGDYPPIVASILYVVMVKVIGPMYVHPIRDGKYVQSETTKKFWINVMIGWNAFLTFYSAVCFYGILSHLIPFWFRLYNNPSSTLSDFICDYNTDHFNKTAWIWQFTFIMSKFPELFDTVIILARGREPDFLHWYHHFTVLVYCWYAGSLLNPLGIYFALINSFVHFVMYDYYKMQGYGVRISYAQRITQIQITQMVIGIILSGIMAKISREDKSCGAKPNQYTDILLIGTATMYGSYLLLFLQFYIKRFFYGATRPKIEKKVE